MKTVIIMFSQPSVNCWKRINIITARFPKYAFKENIICIGFMNGMFSWYIFFMTDTKIKERVSFESSGKKTFACAIFGKICYVACVINRTGRLIFRRADLHECDFSLTSFHLKARFNKVIIVFIMGTIEH